MASSDRAELLRRARDACRAHGRGFIVAHEGREERHCGLLEELEENLAEESDARGLLIVARKAVEEYDPEREAVLIDSRPDGICVLIVGEKGSRALGTLR
ncbi:MAG: hypothetical protein ACM3JH_10320 [Acidithiobacillales bacterium]